MGRGRGRGGTGLREGGGRASALSAASPSPPPRRGAAHARPNGRSASRRLLRAATDGPGGAATFPRAGGGGEARPRLAAGQSPAAAPPRDAAPPTAAAVVTRRRRAPSPALPGCTRARSTAPRASPGSRPAFGPARGGAGLGARGRHVPGAAARGGHRSAAGCGPGRGSYRSRAAAPSAGPGEDPWLAESGLPLRSEPLGRVAALAQSWRVRRARGPPPGALCGGDGAGRTGLRWVEVAPRLLRTAPRTPTRCRGRIPNAARCDLPPVPSFSCATLLPSRLIYPRESAVPIAPTPIAVLGVRPSRCTPGRGRAQRPRDVLRGVGWAFQTRTSLCEDRK